MQQKVTARGAALVLPGWSVWVWRFVEAGPNQPRGPNLVGEGAPLFKPFPTTTAAARHSIIPNPKPCCRHISGHLIQSRPPRRMTLLAVRPAESYDPDTYACAATGPLTVSRRLSGEVSDHKDVLAAQRSKLTPAHLSWPASCRRQWYQCSQLINNPPLRAMCF